MLFENNFFTGGKDVKVLSSLDDVLCSLSIYDTDRLLKIRSYCVNILNKAESTENLV